MNSSRIRYRLLIIDTLAETLFDTLAETLLVIFNRGTQAGINTLAHSRGHPSEYLTFTIFILFHRTRESVQC